MHPIRRVSPTEAAALIEHDGYVHIDVRSVGEYEQGHPADSYNVPLAVPGPGGMAPNPDFLGVMLAKFPLGERLVISCQAGRRSARACELLREAGYECLVDQRAGWGGARDPFGRVQEAGWSAAGLPIESGPSASRGYAALVVK